MQRSAERSITAATVLLLSLLGVAPAAAQVCLTPLAEEEPLCNAEMADSAWGTSHRVSYAQASSPFPGPEAGVSVTAQHVVLPGPPIALAFSSPYADSGRAIWGSPLGLAGATVKLDQDTFQVIDLYIPADREPSPPPVVPGISGAYNVIDRDDRFIVGRTSAIEVFADSVAGDRFSPIQLLNRYFLPPQAFCRPSEDVVAGMVLLYDGHIAFVTEQGVLGRIPRDPAQMLDANLDTFSINGADCADAGIASEHLEEVSNSLAADEDGGIYLVASEAMYKFRFDGTQLIQEWRAEYEVDPNLGGVRLGEGSGSTPTLMGTELDDDQFVVVTDAQRLMRLVLFWRDEIPAGWQPIAPGKDPRIACEFPITFGNPSATESLSEQSVLVRGHSAVVVNNQLQDPTLFSGEIEIIRNALSALEGGNPAQAPLGLERVDWDAATRTCRSVWANRTVSIPNGIPGMSASTGLVYGIGQQAGVWGVEGIDFATGESRLFAPGMEQPCSQASLDAVNPLLRPFVQESLDRLPNSCENAFFAGTEVGPDGAVYTGTFVGASKYAPASVTPPLPRPQAVAGARQGADLATRALADFLSEPARALDAIQRALLQLPAALVALSSAESQGAIGPFVATSAAASLSAAEAHFAAAEAAFGIDPMVAEAELEAALVDLAVAVSALDSCPRAPRSGCATGGFSRLVLNEDDDPGRSRLHWRLSRAATAAQSAFGDPTSSTDFAVCLYDGAQRVASLDLPAPSEPWRITSRVHRFRDPSGSRNGLELIVLRGKDLDRTSLVVSARGTELPTLNLPLYGGATVQLLNVESGACWESRFEADDVRRNDDSRFLARAAP